MKKISRKQQVRLRKKFARQRALRIYRELEQKFSLDDLKVYKLFVSLREGLKRSGLKPCHVGGLDLIRLGKFRLVLRERFESDLERLQRLPFSPDRFDAFVVRLRALAEALGVSLEDFIPEEKRKALRLAKQKECAEDALRIMSSGSLGDVSVFDNCLRTIARYLASARLTLRHFGSELSWEGIGAMRQAVLARGANSIVPVATL